MTLQWGDVAIQRRAHEYAARRRSRRRGHKLLLRKIRQALLECLVLMVLVWGMGYLCILGWNWRMGVL